MSGRRERPDPGKPFLLIFEPIADSRTDFHGGALFQIKSAHASRLALPSWIVEIARAEGEGSARLPAIGFEAGDVVDRQNRHAWMRVLDAALRRSGVEDYVLLPLSNPAGGAGRVDLTAVTGDAGNRSCAAYSATPWNSCCTNRRAPARLGWLSSA